MYFGLYNGTLYNEGLFKVLLYDQVFGSKIEISNIRETERDHNLFTEDLSLKVLWNLLSLKLPEYQEGFQYLWISSHIRRKNTTFRINFFDTFYTFEQNLHCRQSCWSCCLSCWERPSCSSPPTFLSSSRIFNKHKLSILFFAEWLSDNPLATAFQLQEKEKKLRPNISLWMKCDSMFNLGSLDLSPLSNCYLLGN